MRNAYRLLTAVLLGAVTPVHGAGDGVVVIAHPGMSAIDSPTLLRIYKGQVVEIDGSPVVAVNAPTGSGLRKRFLQDYVHLNEEGYAVYWISRRYSGLGVSPKDLGNAAEVIRFVNNTPGAIGYIDENDVVPGVNVVAR
jgi:ABC-type phosphate transport system substrate-binding protein